MLRRSPLLPFVLGLAATYVAERTLSGTARWITLGVGALLLALGLGLALWRVWRAARGSGKEARKAAATAVSGYLLCLVALGMYALTAALLEGAEHATARTVVTIAWPFVLLLGLVPTLTVELALGSMAQSPMLELWRVRLAGRAARVIVYAFIVFAGVNYAASQWNRKIDLSYFRTTEPSAPTLTLVRNLSEAVRLVLFAPPGNEVMDDARDYLATLAAASPQLKFEVVDQARAPELAREMKVRQNGVLVIAKDGHNETLQIGLDIEAARSTLRKLDSEVQERLLKVTRPPRTIYLTTGHLERDYMNSASDKRLGISEFKMLAESQGFTVKPLGLGEGLGSEIPKDAGVVVVAGPTEPFLPAENEAIRAYLDRGGRLFAFIDPDTGVTEDDLLAPLGVRVTKTLVASSRATVRIQGRGDSPYNFATIRTSSHPSVTTLSQNTGRMAVVFLGAGAVEKRKDAAGDLRQVFTVHAMEEKNAPELVAAIERPAKPQAGKTAKDAAPASTPMRAIVVGDADVLGDGILGNPGNAYFVADGLKWLAGDEQLAGKSTSEEDVPLIHKRADDTVWFYGVSFAAPVAVLALGFAVSRKSKKRSAS